MRAVWDFGGLLTGTTALVASQLPELPGLSPWINYGGLGLLAVTLLGLLYREQQRSKEQSDAAASERQRAAERYDHLVELVQQAKCQGCPMREGDK